MKKLYIDVDNIINIIKTTKDEQVKNFYINFCKTHKIEYKK